MSFDTIVTQVEKQAPEKTKHRSLFSCCCKKQRGEVLYVDEPPFKQFD